MNRPFNKSTWPKPNPKIEAALGRFIISWNLLEQQMDFAIQEICRLADDIGSSITANLGTKAKLDMYISLCHNLREVVGDEIVSQADSLTADTGNASGELRNFIVHGQPFQLHLPKGPVDFWAKFSARKGGVRGRGVRLTPSYVNQGTAEIKALFERWVDLRTKIHEAIEILDLIPHSFDEGQQFELLSRRPRAQAKKSSDKIG